MAGQSGRIALWIVLAVLSLSGLAPCRAADEVRIESVQVGLQGHLKVGRWTSVRVIVSGPADREVAPAIVAPDPDGSATTWPLPSVTLNGDQPVESVGVFQVGRMTGALRIEAEGSVLSIPLQPRGTTRDEGAVQSDRQSVTYVGVLGPAAGFEQAFSADVGDVAGSRVIRFEDPSELPSSIEAYDALNVLVLSQRFDLDQDRNAALAGWVSHGGHLVLTFGTAPDAYAGSSVAAWTPVTAEGSVNVSDVASLADRVIGSPPLAAGRGIPGVRIAAPEGIELAGSLRGPLIVRSAYGLGRVTAFALDWTQPPLSTWKGLPGLCRYLADAEASRARSEGPSGSQLRPTGVSELATQLSGQLDHFPQVERPSYWTVIGLAVAFLLLVGPLDYLLVHRLLRQPRLTWLTLPAWVAIAALSGNAVANQMNPTERHANQVTLLDADGETGLLRVQSWMTVYSPAPRRYEVAAEVVDWGVGFEAAPRSPVVTWAGIPESGFRGMYRAGGLDLANAPYSIGPDRDRIDNLPIGYASSKAVQAEWRSSAQFIVRSDLQDDGSGRLQGTLTHDLPVGITDYCLAYRNLAYVPRATAINGRAPSLPPGLAWNPAESLQPRILDRYLKGITYRYVEDEKRKGHEGVPNQRDYDPLGLDSLAWARVLTFHDVTGGPQYTTLSNHALAESDLSRLLGLNRAVLFGRIESPAVTYAVDGEEASPERQWTFVRLVLPVRPADAESR